MTAKLEAGHKGPDIRNDCWIRIHPEQSGIQITSTVDRLYGEAIRSTITQAAQELGLGLGRGEVGIEVVDAGAFDFCLRARLEAAAHPLTGRFLDLPRRSGDSRLGRLQTRLYLPGNTPKFFINASLHAPDVVILDLEDSVPIEEKGAARSLVRHALGSVDFGPCLRMVRPNRGPDGDLDLAALEGCDIDLLLVPKVESPDELERFSGPWKLIPLIESALGLQNAFAIASHASVVAISLGIEDYTTDVGARGRQPTTLDFAYSQLVNAARAAGVAPLGSVYSQVDDLMGFAESTRSLSARGIEGVGCLHPKQIPVARKAFLPSVEEMEWARRILSATDLQGGATSVAGQMIDAPLVRRAHRILSDASEQSDWRLA